MLFLFFPVLFTFSQKIAFMTNKKNKINQILFS
jgi:hypothetical protein